MGFFDRGTKKRGGRRSADPSGEFAEGELPLRRSEAEALLEDLSAGAKYQQALLPQRPPEVPGYDIATFYRPARTLSGDFFDLLPAGPATLAFVIADASGKSIPASLVAMMCHLLFRVRPEPAASPARVLTHVNRLLLGNIKRGTFVTCIYALLDYERHTLTVANAGHLPLVVWRSKEKLAMTYRAHGPVLGVLPPETYDSALPEETVEIGPGDRFVLLTDGVNEAMAPGQKEFGMEHLRQRLKGGSDGLGSMFLKGIVEQIELHRGGGEQSDDITLVTARRQP
jgi:sigma-B regulation protein RsbU (phosphoserine phosphatase)